MSKNVKKIPKKLCKEWYYYYPDNLQIPIKSNTECYYYQPEDFNIPKEIKPNIKKPTNKLLKESTTNALLEELNPWKEYTKLYYKAIKGTDIEPSYANASKGYPQWHFEKYGRYPNSYLQKLAKGGFY